MQSRNVSARLGGILLLLGTVGCDALLGIEQLSQSPGSDGAVADASLIDGEGIDSDPLLPDAGGPIRYGHDTPLADSLELSANVIYALPIQIRYYTCVTRIGVIAKGSYTPSAQVKLSFYTIGGSEITPYQRIGDEITISIADEDPVEGAMPNTVVESGFKWLLVRSDQNLTIGTGPADTALYNYTYSGHPFETALPVMFDSADAEKWMTDTNEGFNIYIDGTIIQSDAATECPQ